MTSVSRTGCAASAAGAWIVTGASGAGAAASAAGSSWTVDDRRVVGLQEALAEQADRLAGEPDHNQAAVGQHDRPVADGAHLVGRVRDEDDRPALALEDLDPLEALALEALVADGQDLVDHEHVGIDVDSHREAEADVHAR